MGNIFCSFCNIYCLIYNNFCLRTCFVPFATFIVLFGTHFVRAHFLVHFSNFISRQTYANNNNKASFRTFEHSSRSKIPKFPRFLGEGEEGEEDDPDEYIHVNEKYYYLEYIIRGLGITHAIVSFCMCIAYYNLKVPLAIFKREKEVARRLEFDGLYLAEQPEDDDMKGHWDKLIISAKYVFF